MKKIKSPYKKKTKESQYYIVIYGCNREDHIAKSANVILNGNNIISFQALEIVDIKKCDGTCGIPKWWPKDTHPSNFFA